MVDRLDVHLGRSLEILQAQMGVLSMAAHREVRSVDLQHEPGRCDAQILLTYGLGEGEQVRVVTVVVHVGQVQRDHSGGRRADERLDDRGCGQRGAEVGQILLEARMTGIGDLGCAGWGRGVEPGKGFLGPCRG